MEYVIDLVDWYREVLREDPSSELFVLLAEALHSEGRWEEAVKTCREGLFRHPANLRAKVLLGLCLMQLGETEESQKVLESARHELEKNAGLYEVLSQLAMEGGDMEAAGRFSEIYRDMQAGSAFVGDYQPTIPMDENVEQAEENFEARVPEEELIPTEQPTQHEVFLSSWLQRYEAKEEPHSGNVKLFSDFERKLLRRLLTKSEG